MESLRMYEGIYESSIASNETGKVLATSRAKAWQWRDRRVVMMDQGVDIALMAGLVVLMAELQVRRNGGPVGGC